jgi:hypothetical protein
MALYSDESLGMTPPIEDAMMNIGKMGKGILDKRRKTKDAETREGMLEREKKVAAYGAKGMPSPMMDALKTPASSAPAPVPDFMKQSTEQFGQIAPNYPQVAPQLGANAQTFGQFPQQMPQQIPLRSQQVPQQMPLPSQQQMPPASAYADPEAGAYQGPTFSPQQQQMPLNPNAGPYQRLMETQQGMPTPHSQQAGFFGDMWSGAKKLWNSGNRNARPWQEQQGRVLGMKA